MSPRVVAVLMNKEPRMTKLVAAVLVFIGALITVSSSQAHADWTYRTGRGSGPPPCGAFRPIVSYGPHTRCVARLIQLPSGWWQQRRTCERI
jgi:hypothetical protein